MSAEEKGGSRVLLSTVWLCSPNCMVLLVPSVTSAIRIELWQKIVPNCEASRAA